MSRSRAAHSANAEPTYSVDGHPFADAPLLPAPWEVTYFLSGVKISFERTSTEFSAKDRERARLVCQDALRLLFPDDSIAHVRRPLGA